MSWMNGTGSKIYNRRPRKPISFGCHMFPIRSSRLSRHPFMCELTAFTFECARCAAVHVTMSVSEHQDGSHAR